MKHQIKAMTAYRLHSVKKTFFIATLCMCALYLVSLISAQIFSGPNVNFTMNGIEIIYLITAFVVGLCSFKDEFLFFSVSGVSRRTQLVGAAISFLALSGILSVLITLFDFLFTLLHGKLQYSSMFYLLYSGKPFSNLALSATLEEPGFTQTILPSLILGSLLWRMCTLVFALFLGYFISCAYFRMNKAMKIIISVGVPLTFLYLLPALDYFVLNGQLLSQLTSFFSFFLGYPFTSNLVFLSCLCFFVAGMGFFGLSILLVRRARIRK